jgi:hypothetical protein
LFEEVIIMVASNDEAVDIEKIGLHLH